MCGPKRTVTNRGKPFWNKDHSANNQLRDDTRSGKTKAMKPKELWESNVIYQDFSSDFRKHIYQEKYKQLAGPYWQKKRNKAALKKHKEEVRKLHEEALHNKYDGEMDDIVQGFGLI